MTSYFILQVIGALVLLIWALAMVEQLIKKGFDLGVFVLFMASLFLLLIVIIPDSFRNLFEKIGFLRPLDAFLVITSIISLLLVANMYLKQKELDRNMTKIVQNISLKDLDEYKNKK